MKATVVRPTLMLHLVFHHPYLLTRNNSSSPLTFRLILCRHPKSPPEHHWITYLRTVPWGTIPAIGAVEKETTYLRVQCWLWQIRVIRWTRQLLPAHLYWTETKVTEVKAALASSLSANQNKSHHHYYAQPAPMGKYPNQQSKKV